MTLYELLEQISDILTPKTHSLYDYMIHTFDDGGGFLRTRYCYRKKPIADFAVEDQNMILICFREPFHEGRPYYRPDPYTESGFGDKLTLVKMQMFYTPGDMERDIEWSCLFPYPEACIVNLKEKTFEVKHYDPIT